MLSRKIRLGIDVGGTFTKAVAIDNETYKIVGKAEVLTTHGAPEGVAKGVVNVFHKILNECQIEPTDVTFIAHSTTQATNALLEGDVANVGVVGMGKGIGSLLAQRETRCEEIKLPQGRISVYNQFINSSELNTDRAAQKIDALVSAGAKVIVASEAFGVDDPTAEMLIQQVAVSKGLPSTIASEITKLYGLTVRTKTAVVNASILPKMMETANMTEESVKQAGIKAPLMIMRGDGGVMIIDEVRKRPILTMLSGPAASVAGALMYLRVTDGIFFEVGGTSTNIGVIRNGRPMQKYVEIAGHKTFVNSLDVRVIGVAGGSMVRINNGKIVDVGPRSAHIAGYPYSAFSNADDIVNPEIELVQPKTDDPLEYVVVRSANGKKCAITNTCAANVLGLVKEGDFAYGNRDAARKAFEPLAKKLGTTVEKAAQRILEISSAKQIQIINDLMKEYRLEKENVVLVGGGGGAAALIPFTAKVMGLPYKISDDAEVISSIGVALAMVRESVERTIAMPTPNDILRVKREAEEAAIKSGAKQESIEIFVEIDGKTQVVRATAIGSTEMRTQNVSTAETSLEERKKIAAESMNVDGVERVNLLTATDTFDVFGTKIVEKHLFIKKNVSLIRVMDKKGVIRLKLKDAHAVPSSVEKTTQNDLTFYLKEYSQFTDAGLTLPRPYILVGGRIIDLSGLQSMEQIQSIGAAELGGFNPETPTVLLFAHSI